MRWIRACVLSACCFLAFACGRTGTSPGPEGDVSDAATVEADVGPETPRTVDSTVKEILDSGPGPDASDAPDAPDAAELLDAGDVAADSADGLADAVPDGATEVAPDVVEADCPQLKPPDYTCDAADPVDNCPKGLCLGGLCIGPVVNPDRWKDCDDGVCGPCETAASCPADCGSPPAMTGSKDYDNDTTITVWVHGFYNKSPDEMAEDVYGADGGCGGTLGLLSEYGIQRPCGNTPEGEKAPNQLCKVEYYGGVPVGWMTPEDVAEVEAFPYTGGPEGLPRYALVAAKFIRHKLDLSGATHVNLACHSMGCLITRYMIENNVENLAAENRFVRWYTSNGVLAGARLARLFDNPTVRAGAEALGLELSDFILMNPDYVQDNACSWDHKLQEGNNPLFAAMLIHHACATDPKIAEALGIQLLDLNNPGDEPNDGIMYTFDEYFHAQHPDAALVTPAGDVLESSHVFGYFDHMTLPDTEMSGVLATATLFHHRRAEVKLAQIELLNDREADSLIDFSEHGTAPADISWSVQVRYNPYVVQTFGKNVLVHEDKPDHRSAPLFQQEQGQVLVPGMTLFAAPVFDGMESLQLDLDLLEMDWYPRFGIGEWVFDPDQSLVKWSGQVPLVDGTIEINSEYAKVKLEVRVYELY